MKTTTLARNGVSTQMVDLIGRLVELIAWPAWLSSCATTPFVQDEDIINGTLVNTNSLRHRHSARRALVL